MEPDSGSGPLLIMGGTASFPSVEQQKAWRIAELVRELAGCKHTQKRLLRALAALLEREPELDTEDGRFCHYCGAQAEYESEANDYAAMPHRADCPYVIGKGLLKELEA